jgi:hypothetical protein
MKISVPFSTTVSTFLADMIDFPCFHGRETRTSRLRPCPSARPGVASATATRAEGDRPPFRAAQGAGLHKRVPSFGEEDRRKSAEDAGRPLGSAPVLAGALARARGGAPSVSFMRKRSIGPVPAKPPGGATKKSSRRSVSIAPPSGGTRDRVPPARDTLSRARDRSHWPRRCAAQFTRARCGACRTRVKKFQLANCILANVTGRPDLPSLAVISARIAVGTLGTAMREQSQRYARLSSPRQS